MPLERRQIAELTAAMQQPAALADPAAWRTAASELTALLPPPIVTRLDAAARVVIIPHEILWRVPFQALPSGEGYLGDHASVVLAGSVSMAAAAMERVPASGASLLVVGAPELTPSRIEGMKQVAPAWTLRAPDDASQELAAASAGQPDAKESLAGSAATERAVREGAVARRSRAPRGAVPNQRREPALFGGPAHGARVASDPTGSLPHPMPRRRVPPPQPVDASDDGALELREVMNLTSPARRRCAVGRCRDVDA